MFSSVPVRSPQNIEFFLTVQVPEPDRAQIKCLTEESAILLWSSLVSNDLCQSLTRQLSHEHWSHAQVSWGPNWVEYANNPIIPDEVALFLRSELLWPDEQTVYFVHNSHSALQVPWLIFLRNWRAFLFKNDDPIIVCPERPEYVVFSDGGGLAWGYRLAQNKGDGHV